MTSTSDRKFLPRGGMTIGNYRWLSADVGTAVEISVYYTKGGMDYSTYKLKRRGIYISINTMVRSVNSNFVTEKYSPMAAGGFFVKELGKRSDKELLSVIQTIYPCVEDASKLWLAGENDAALMVLKSAIWPLSPE